MSIINELGASGILIIDGKALVIKRSKEDTSPGQWEPPKGKTEGGEEPSQTIVREFDEEAGLKVKVKKSLGITNWGYKRDGNDYRITESVFEVSLADGETVSNLSLSDDHDEFRWINSEALKVLEPIIEDRRQFLLASLGE